MTIKIEDCDNTEIGVANWGFISLVKTTLLNVKKEWAEFRKSNESIYHVFSLTYSTDTQTITCKDIKNLGHAWKGAIQLYKQVNKHQMKS